MARRYDSRTTIFSPEGRLYQVEYAMEAISNAGAAIGMLAKDGVVLVAEKKVTSKVRAQIDLLHGKADVAACPAPSPPLRCPCSSDPAAPRHSRRWRAAGEDVQAGRPHRVRSGRHHL